MTKNGEERTQNGQKWTEFDKNEQKKDKKFALSQGSN